VISRLAGAVAALLVVVASCTDATRPAATDTVDGADENPVAWRPSAGPADWLPPGDAVFLVGSWWALLSPPAIDSTTTDPPAFSFGEIIAWSAADLDGDQEQEFVVSYRHPARKVPWDPRPQATDAHGRTSHLGVVEANGTPVWLAHRVPHPIAALAACGDRVALAYDTPDDSAIVAATAATWNGFGFTIAPELPGQATVGCADVDDDGTTEPVVLRDRDG